MAHLISIRPFITEKAMHQAQHGKYTFVVNKGASKLAIEQEIAKTYKVHVLGVNITKRPPKVKARGVQQARIKAIVTLQKGETIKGFDLPQAEEAKPEAKNEVKATKAKVATAASEK